MRRVNGLGQVRHSPCPRRIVGQTSHVWIVFAEPLLHQLGRPRLKRETGGKVLTDVEGERGASDFQAAAESACLRLALVDHRRVPDPREVRLPVREPRRWGGQIRSPVGPSRRAGRGIAHPLFEAGSRRPYHRDAHQNEHVCDVHISILYSESMSEP